MKIKAVLAAVLCAALLTGCAGKTENSAPDNSAPVLDTSNAFEDAPAEKSEDSTADTSASDTSAAVTEESPAEPATEPIVRDFDYEHDKVVALTFDDGPNTTTTIEVCEVLKKHGVVGSFFLVGNNINEESAKAVKYAYDLGCEIDNHSKTHSYMNEMSAEDCTAEIQYVDEKVFEITGEHTKFFRPPYIAISNQMWDYIDIPFISGVGCDDWNPKVTTERRVAYIEKKAQDGGLDGCVVLLHDAEGNDQTVAALDEIIPALKEMGYKFVTVSELFEEKGVTPEPLKLYTDVEQQGMWS